MNQFFIELSIVLFIALLISFVMTKLKQPLLIGYIFTGIIAGPLFLNILSSAEGYESYSHIGVAFLLFIVGLHLNLKLIKEIGVVSLFVGFAQIVFTTLFGFLISYIFGFGFFASFLIGIALSFSSTIIIVKILTDMHEIDKTHGKLSMGILIVQDLVAVLMLMVLATIFTSSSDVKGLGVFKIFFYGVLALASVLIFSKFMLEKILDKAALSHDLLFIFIISWCLGIGALFGILGFSVEIGALIAGVALASSKYQYEISSKVKPLRDFFIVMFFILLGSQMIPISQSASGNSFEYILSNFSTILVPAIVLSLFVIFIKPIIVFMLFNVLKFNSKVGFISGVSLGQVSEFSLIMIMIASSMKLVTPEVVTLITFVAIVTIIVSTYFMMSSVKLYNKFSNVLRHFELFTPKKENTNEVTKKHDILIFGYDRIGFALLKSIKKLKKNYLVVDYNPIVIKKLKEEGINCVYGDASDSEFLSEFDIEDVEMLISTIPDTVTNNVLFDNFKKRNTTGVVILTANQISDALELYNKGADYVVLPHFLGGNYVSTLIEGSDESFSNLLKEKIIHINELKERKAHGFEHPKEHRA